MIYRQKKHIKRPFSIWLGVTCLIYSSCCPLGSLAKEPAVNGKISKLMTKSGNQKNSQSQVVSIPPKPYKPANISSLSKTGKILFVRNNCVACHSVGNHGGCLGPPLLGEGSRRSKDFILSRITQGAKAEAKFQDLYKASELMPHPRVPEKTAEAITAYLLTLDEPKSGFIMTKHQIASDNTVSSPAQTNKSNPESIAAGKKLFYEKGCAGCHTAGGVGGQFAPSLDGIGTKRERGHIEQIINNAQTLGLGSADEYNGRGTMMPPLNLTPAEASKITDFLMTLPPR